MESSLLQANNLEENFENLLLFQSADEEGEVFYNISQQLPSEKEFKDIQARIFKKPVLSQPKLAVSLHTASYIEANKNNQVI